jgi:hypothetical protein
MFATTCRLVRFVRVMKPDDELLLDDPVLVLEPLEPLEVVPALTV